MCRHRFQASPSRSTKLNFGMVFKSNLTQRHGHQEKVLGSYRKPPVHTVLTTGPDTDLDLVYEKYSKGTNNVGPIARTVVAKNIQAHQTVGDIRRVIAGILDSTVKGPNTVASTSEAITYALNPIFHKQTQISPPHTTSAGTSPFIVTNIFKSTSTSPPHAISTGTSPYTVTNNLKSASTSTSPLHVMSSVAIQTSPLSGAAGTVSRSSSGISSQSPVSESVLTGLGFVVSGSPSGTVSSQDTFLDLQVPVLSVNDIVPVMDTESGKPVVLGRGTYGAAFLASMATSPDSSVVLKIMEMSVNENEVFMEARIQKYLEDTLYVPRLHGVIPGDGVAGCATVQECICGGLTLADAIENIFLSEEAWVGVCKQLVMGLMAIHQKGILHNDIKADNVMLDDSGEESSYRVIYIDFGLARFNTPMVYQLPIEELEKYSHLAPEVRHHSPTSTASDVYSLGCIFYVLAAREVPCLTNLAAGCLNSDPVKRPSLQAILEDLEAFAGEEF